jgi:hypothetical protein
MAKMAVLEIRKGMGSFGYLMRSYSGNTTFDESWDKSNFRVIVSRLTLCDLNRVQYRVDQEERDDMFGLATYGIPNHGNLCYSGLRGQCLVGHLSHTAQTCLSFLLRTSLLM